MRNAPRIKVTAKTTVDTWMGDSISGEYGPTFRKEGFGNLTFTNLSLNEIRYILDSVRQGFGLNLPIQDLIKATLSQLPDNEVEKAWRDYADSAE